MGTAKGNIGRKMYSDPLWRQKISRTMTHKRTMVTKRCPRCGEVFTVERLINLNGEEKISLKERQFCSRRCANGRIISESQKKNIGNKLRKRENRVCPICKCIFETTFCGQQRFCSRKCVYIHQRKSPDGTLIDYRQKCAFRFNLSKYPKEFNFNLVKKHGWYRAKNKGNNMGGVSRDHKYSVVDGFKNQVSPEIVAHPANCRLILQKYNAGKWSRSIVSLEKLKELISIWDNKYKKDF